MNELNIGGWIRKRRKELGITQDELASKMGLSGKSSVSRMEKKNDFKITLTNLMKYADALDVPLLYFFQDEDCVIDDIPF